MFLISKKIFFVSAILLFIAQKPMYAHEASLLRMPLVAIGKFHMQLSLAFTDYPEPSSCYDKTLSVIYFSFAQAQYNKSLPKTQIISSPELKNFGIQSIIFSQQTTSKTSNPHIALFFVDGAIDKEGYFTHWYCWKNTYANPAEYCLEISIYKKDFLKSFNPLEFLIQNRKPRFIIDPGHGGKALGACYRPEASQPELREKDLNLDIAQNLAIFLNQQGIEPLLTRANDTDVSLDQRGIHSMNREGDVFISIHNNATAQPKSRYPFIHGTETYRLASETILEQCGPKHFLFTKMTHTQDVIKMFVEHWQAQKQLSSLLAQCIQKNIVSMVKEKTGYQLTDRGEKTAYFRVLRLSTPTIPAILIENGFMCNEEECKKLGDPAFRKILAQATCNGLIDFMNKCLPLN